ncbi:GGDEF domain-containing protein [Aquincola sp. MAHUQ-54]|uniref:diguanylate cyclase n=1 Tax=Aquincola agrisoli TaxID=3119538 RepID=A0AAW9QFC0_9BURK
MRRVRLSPIGRIAAGLVAMTSMLVLVLDLVLGVFPAEGEVARQVRLRIVNALAMQLAAIMQRPQEQALLLRTMHDVVAVEPDLLSVGLRREDGSLLAATRRHAQDWKLPADGRSNLTHVMVDLQRNGVRWGRIEARFRPLASSTLPGWLAQRWVQFSLLLAGLGFVLYHLYLRRVLQHLDPSATIPERVKSAFDTLTEAVMIVDDRGRILMANQAFGALHPDAVRDHLGRPASGLPWLAAAMPHDAAQHAWARVMDSREAVTGEVLNIAQPDGGPPRKLVLNASPVQDGGGRVRGALVTFDDVTELDRMNVQLRTALTELEASRQEIEAKNRELTELATKDPMTGCFNRRAFFDAFDPIFARARAGGALCAIMTDIDHFKSFNDKYGHAVGDLVIKAVARTLGATLRPQDVLARYGGEEFCILLPELDLEQAWAVADRLRHQIETQAGQSIEGHGALRITSSFGVASIVQGAETPHQLLEQADGALYVAKRNGRNRAQKWNAGETALAGH